MVAGRVPIWSRRAQRHHAAVRSPRDSRAFLHEEKFDTWLDLEDCKKVRDYARGVEGWRTSMYTRSSEPLIPFPCETSCELSVIGVTPKVVRTAIISPTLPAQIVQYIISEGSTRSMMSSSNFRRLTSTVQEAASRSLELQLSHYMQNTSKSYDDHVWDAIHVWHEKMTMLPSEVMRAWAAAEDMLSCLEVHRQLYEFSPQRVVMKRTEHRINKIQQKYDMRGGIPIPSIRGRMYITKDSPILHFQGRHYLMNRPLFLELVNKVVELFCALVYTHMMDGTVMPAGHLTHFRQFLYEMCSKVVQWAPSDASTYNMSRANKGFTFLKTVEGLGVAIIILREDGARGWVNDTLLHNLWESLYDDDVVDTSNIFDSTFWELMNSMKTEQIAEVIGTVKLCGHPSIEFEKGLDKLYARTHNAIHVDPVAVENSCGVVKRDLMINFYKRHQRYPEIDRLKGDLHPAIKRILINNNPPHSHAFRQARNTLSPRDWNTIHFTKNGDFDPVDNQIVLLKDKALGITRSKVLQLLALGREKWTAQDKGSVMERRALLQFLLSQYLSDDFHDYLREFSTGEDIDASVLEYLVIKLTAKELEEKPEGRMFGSSPMVERNRRIVMEMNVMNLMDLYEPDQLLTPDELSIIRKMYSFRHFGGMFPNHVLMQVSFDFSKWNNNMRRASIDVPAGEVLDPWFGVHLYCKTMLAYENALVYYTDQHRTRYWDGQLGGIEGLNQATWSLFFLGGIKHMLEERGLMYQVTVKGDDVRAAIAVPENMMATPQDIENVKRGILHDLQQLCHRMGWELNPHECFVSLSVIATSKQYQVRNTWLPASTKKAMKMASLSNLVFPTLEDVVSSIFSTAHSTCAQSTTVIPAFATATLLASIEIYRELPLVSRDTYMLTAALLWPQVLGGPGSLPLQTFFIRGENDMLSVSVSLLRYVLRSNDDKLKEYVTNILSQDLTPVPDGKLLLSDPYALSLEIPERPASVLKKLLREALGKWTKNPHILQLLETSTDEDEKAFVTHLLSMIPYCAKVATTLWECSPFYIIEEILSRFMQSSTIFSFFSLGPGRRLNPASAHRKLSKVLGAARRRSQYWQDVIAGHNLGDDNIYLGVPVQSWLDGDICTTQIIHMIRGVAWGSVVAGDIHGITYPSIVDQTLLFQPKDLIKSHPHWEIPCIVTNMMCDPNAAHPQTTTLDSHHYSASSRAVPWLGAVTSSKLELPSVAPDIRSPTISKVLRLINLKRSGHFIGLEFTRTADMVIRSLTSVNLQDLVVLSPESGGGHIPHRVAINAFSMTTMPNFRPNLLQLVDMARDQGSVFTGDTHNRTINFAARYYHSIVLATWPLQSHRMMPDGYPRVHNVVFHYDKQTDRSEGAYMPCLWCCQDVNDVEVRFSDPTCPDMSRYRSIPLVGASDCDNKLLRAGCEKALVGRVHREARRMNMDASNPLAIEAAATIIINKLAKESSVLTNASAARGFSQVPMGNMIEVFAVTLGIKSINTVSMNLVRAIPVDDLYLCVLKEYLSWYFNYVTDSYETDDLSLVHLMMPHKNQMLHLFSFLANASQFARIVAGCNRRGWAPIDVAATAHNSPSLFFTSFASAHEHLVSSVLTGDMALMDNKLMLNCEGSDRIMERLEKHFSRVRRLCLRRCIPIKGEGNIYQVLDRQCHDLFGAKWADIILQLQHYNTLNEIFEEDPESQISFDLQLLLHHISTWWVEGGVTAEALHQMFYLVYLPIMIRFADDCAQAAENTDLISVNLWTVVLMDYGYVEQAEWNTNLFINDPDLGWVVEKIVQRVQYSAWFKLLSYWSLDSMTFDDYRITQPFLDLIHTIIKSFGPVRLIRMVSEDADRILRQAGLNEDGLSEMEVNRMHLRARIGLVERAAQEDEGIQMPRDILCGICESDPMSTQLMRSLIAAGPYVRTTDPLYKAWPHDIFCELVDWDLDRSGHLTYVDNSEFLRSIGWHNTSAAKYAELLVNSGALEFCRQNPNPQAVLCLADGLGGVTALIMRAIPQAIVLYNSLYKLPGSERSIADANQTMPPMEVMSYSADPEWRARCIYQGLFPGNLCYPEVQDMIVATTRSLHHSVSLITCDADIEWKAGMSLAKDIIHAVLNIVIELECVASFVIIKTFAVKDPVFNRWLWDLGGIFNHMHIVRCQATRPRSTEVFIVIPPLGECDLGHMAARLRQVYTGDGGYANSMTRSTWLSHQLQPVSQMIQRYLDTNQGEVIDHHAMIERYDVCAARPLSLNACLIALCCQSMYTGGHLCRLMEALSHLFEITRERLTDHLNHMIPLSRQGVQKFTPIRTPKGTAITQGEKAVLHTLRRLTKVTIALSLSRMTRYNALPPDKRNYVEAIEDAYGTATAICDRNTSLISWDCDRQGIIIRTPHGIEHLFPSAHAAIKKFCNMVGSLIYACSSERYPQTLGEFHPNLEQSCNNCREARNRIAEWSLHPNIALINIPVSIQAIALEPDFRQLPYRVKASYDQWVGMAAAHGGHDNVADWMRFHEEVVEEHGDEVENFELRDDLVM